MNKCRKFTVALIAIVLALSSVSDLYIENYCMVQKTKGIRDISANVLPNHSYSEVSSSLGDNRAVDMPQYRILGSIPYIPYYRAPNYTEDYVMDYEDSPREDQATIDCVPGPDMLENNESKSPEGRYWNLRQFEKWPDSKSLCMV